MLSCITIYVTGLLFYCTMSTTSYSVVFCSFLLVLNLYFSRACTNICCALLLTCTFPKMLSLVSMALAGNHFTVVSSVSGFRKRQTSSPLRDLSYGGAHCAGSAVLFPCLRTSTGSRFAAVPVLANKFRSNSPGYGSLSL